jgi:hypothetical protein
MLDKEHYMRHRALVLLCGVIAIGFILIYIIPGSNSGGLELKQKDESGQQSGLRGEWTRENVDGIELWIAWSDKRTFGIGLRRNIFAYMDSKDFKAEILSAVFTRMSKDYPDCETLSIDIYSDEAKLAQRVNDYRIKRPHISKPLQETVEVEESRNHFFAGYIRTVWPNGLQEEWFAYTPDPTKKDMIRINLKP